MALSEEQRNPWRAIVAGSNYNLSSQDWEDLLTELDSLYTEAIVAPPASDQKPVWEPIATAPRDNKRPLYLARINENGELLEIDFDGGWEFWQESYEMPHVCGWDWCSANGIEEPTHWAFQDVPLPPAPQPEQENYKAQRDALLKSVAQVKSNLMHHRRFGCDTFQAWKNSAARAEGDLEEAIASVKGGA